MTYEEQWRANIAAAIPPWLHGTDEERSQPDWEARQFIRAALVQGFFGVLSRRDEVDSNS